MSLIQQQFKKHLQLNDRPSSGFFLSRIKSQSLGALSSMLDKKPLREKSSIKRSMRSTNISKSSNSLNSLESEETEVRTESLPQTISMDSLVKFSSSCSFFCRCRWFCFDKKPNIAARALNNQILNLHRIQKPASLKTPNRNPKNQFQRTMNHHATSRLKFKLTTSQSVCSKWSAMFYQ